MLSSASIPTSLINKGTIQYLLFLSCLAISITNLSPAAAHKVEVSGDVGGTLHIEPNDNPRAGEPSQAWFALTRRGGKVIPLAQCNCQLAVYAEPYAAGEPALLEPTLKPVAVERYQGIPGAEIVFPKPGLYQLELNGKPASGARFKPFEFKFEVTVAAGSTTNSRNIQNVNTDVAQNENQSLPLWAIALPILGFIAILFVAFRGMRGGSGE
ncbi:hypothetical protein VF14_20035 [Nostoc linckia z18]|uniref:Uncharacterized protein n=2 Tax=Nostoc linckia TaxID=92942 RepID=A0A9Q5Z8S5_NOSLI|nr:hypothetical protein VF02_10255 [Nostoc linckia z1]PHJ70361.1 hypothetical protein VF05_11145 [Nostoc linckia z3]PHJ73583.1 hypothetical protein VF06_35845 [Nostoc linckia z4]PHJ77065.1 hypothetical protein VF03_05595 [Nostoc linckia z2]PHJ89458.1 hypothetical protein VF07_12405 [Nostoc linckia z6]PHK00037.1 hypothetical protein VF08_24685 [Nostoc linckia z8]PHK00984.1 hypothetical protein VF04_01960 [Nostoc linckia z7]PHK02060.1 hypothetical protein VF09_32220 [Nostoc linckia z9]PHK1389